MAKPPRSSSPVWKLVNAAARLNVVAYRLTGGRIGGHLGKAPILLLHHTGRKTGKARVTPVLYLTEGDSLVVVASKGGTDKNPAWFHNLVASDETQVEVGRVRRRVRPRVVSAEEREELWPKLVAIYPSFATYQENAIQRTIPVIALDPVIAPAGQR
jgi:deazaflavin-dependent oxidoreductase (nitroreductase family)